MKDREAEVRLEQLARKVLDEMGLPTESSGVELAQAFMTFGLEEPGRQKVSFKAIFDDFGILGWILAGVFRGKVKLLLERLAQEAEHALRVYRDEQGWLWDEVHLRERLIQAAVWEKQRAQWEAQNEGRKCRDRASRAATKTRNATVDQLRQLLKLASIRLLEQQLEVAKRAQLDEQVQELQEALTKAFRNALGELGDTAKLVDDLAAFDALMNSTSKR
ncbi:MAG: hypothetical protein Q8N84_01290 [bacterium]|nr:hypothetical protein [bacterium]